MTTLLLALLFACDTAPAPAPADAPAPTPPPPAEAAPPPQTTDDLQVGKRQGEEPPWMPEPTLPLAPPIQEASKLVETKDYAGAKAAADAWIASAEGAKDPMAYFWRARAQASLGAMEAAEADLRKANELAPDDFVLRQEMADFLVGTRRCMDALPFLEAQSKARPELAQTWTNLGFCRTRSQQVEQGLADLVKGCELGHERACMMKEQAIKRGQLPAPGSAPAPTPTP